MISLIKLLIERFAVTTFIQALRLIKIVIGFTLLIFGVILIFTPGPAIVVIPIALAILAGEFVWAKQLLKHVNERFNDMTGRKNDKKEQNER
ncbi:MAG: PGPGW domain-containing protein [Nitrospirota bacterium]|nr:MAG: PGPGW domain-containing protein [Nitrospirota bacterium]